MNDPYQMRQFFQHDKLIITNKTTVGEIIREHSKILNEMLNTTFKRIHYEKVYDILKSNSKP